MNCHKANSHGTAGGGAVYICIGYCCTLTNGGEMNIYNRIAWTASKSILLNMQHCISFGCMYFNDYTYYNERVSLVFPVDLFLVLL